MRGERRGPHRRYIWTSGSSPHARGTQQRVPRGPRAVRFIPACAGNATGGRETWSHSTVHPRMRGERLHAAGLCVDGYGSSPHARGTPTSVPGERLLRRFIPACAGNAQSRQPVGPDRAVHPRMRGERHLGVDLPGVRGRFIPACAGNAFSFDWMTLVATGSSPHARGTHRGRGSAGSIHRFIPACAGNAMSPSLSMFREPVHPRMRGERENLLGRFHRDHGSSPHARGTHFQ